MTIAETKAAIRRIEGMTARCRDGEWRVNYVGGKEETAYYTDDPQDALDTAIAMSHERLNA